MEWAPTRFPSIVHGYTREAGVRELERRIGRIARKLARARAESAGLAAAAKPGDAAGARRGARAKTSRRCSASRRIDPALLSLEHKVGVATGLAYTSVGGDVLEIEVSVVGGRGKLQLTGTLGDVMKESASAALSYARTRAGALGIDREFYRNRDLHVHIPAGATPKDGPVGGHRDRHGDRERADRDSGPRRRGDDRRDHAARPRAGDRWPEGEGGRGAPERRSRT